MGRFYFERMPNGLIYCKDRYNGLQRTFNADATLRNGPSCTAIVIVELLAFLKLKGW